MGKDKGRATIHLKHLYVFVLEKNGKNGKIKLTRKLTILQ